jgi:hypothetical protein
VDAKGQPRFNNLLFRRKEPRFFAFDLLHLNGTNCLRDSLAGTANPSQAGTAAILSVRSWTMRSSSCLIEFANADGDSIRCGQSAVADCADCGLSICSDCRAECCGESFCDYCYDYHLTHSCLRKPAQTDERNRQRDQSTA